MLITLWMVTLAVTPAWEMPPGDAPVAEAAASVQAAGEPADAPLLDEHQEGTAPDMAQDATGWDEPQQASWLEEGQTMAPLARLLDESDVPAGNPRWEPVSLLALSPLLPTHAGTEAQPDPAVVLSAEHTPPSTFPPVSNRVIAAGVWPARFLLMGAAAAGAVSFLVGVSLLGVANLVWANVHANVVAPGMGGQWRGAGNVSAVLGAGLLVTALLCAGVAAVAMAASGVTAGFQGDAEEPMPGPADLFER